MQNNLFIGKYVYSGEWSSHYLLYTTIVCSIQYDNNLLAVYPSVKIDHT